MAAQKPTGGSCSARAVEDGACSAMGRRGLHAKVGAGYAQGAMGSAFYLEENEVTILGRALEAGLIRLSAPAAKVFLQAQFPPSDHARMETLAGKAKAGTLQPDERELLDRYVRAAHLLAILKAKARSSLESGKRGTE